ncbi:flagellar brake protein [bacterium]|nr:flagellar brake protein [bacterium]
MPTTRRSIQTQLTLHRPVLVERPSTRTRGMCRILGAQDPNYLILEMPQAQSQPLFTSHNDKCIVRFMSEGSAYGFRGRVTRIFHEPFPMLIVEYPEDYEEITVRSSPRVECNIQVAMRLDAEADALELRATVVDMSTGGIRLAVPIIDPRTPWETLKEYIGEIEISKRQHYHPDSLRRVLREKTHFLLAVHLPEPGAGDYDDLSCEATWVKPHAGHLFVGARFIEPPPELAEKIDSIILYQETFFRPHIDPI